MKGITELALVAILLFLVYDKPAALTEFSNSILGKVILVAAVGFIAKTKGLAAGLVTALIMVILMYTTKKEGLTNKLQCEAKVGDKPQVCANASECGLPVAMCLDENKTKLDNEDGAGGGTCSYWIPSETLLDHDDGVETKVVADVETFDIRLREGLENMRARQRTIEAMQQSNGQTNNREKFMGYM